MEPCFLPQMGIKLELLDQWASVKPSEVPGAHAFPESVPIHLKMLVIQHRHL